MRKFTFFLALMVTMVTTAFAQGSTPIDLASNADQMLYSNAYCTDATWGDEFKSWTVLFDENPATFFHSEYASGKGSTDGLEHYIRVDMGEGNELSLFTFTFTTRNSNCDANSPTAMIVEGSNEADGTYNTIKSIAGLPETNATTWTSEVLGKEDVAYRYIRFRVIETAGIRNYATGHRDANGKPFFFISEFGMNRVAAGAVATKVEYTYTYNNETIGTETFDAFVGDAYPAPSNLPFGYAAKAPEGEVEADAKKTIECVVSLPFEYAEKVADIKTWYRVQMHSNNKMYIQYIDGESYIEWADANVTEGEENSYLWAFVGTPATGFKLVNYAATVEKALCSNGSGNPAMGAYADGVNWKPVASDIAGEGYFCLQYPGSNNYMNAQSGKVAFWSDNDAGSTFVLTKADPVLPAAEPIEPTSTKNYGGDYKFTFITLNFDEKVTATADANGEYGYILNDKDEKVLVLDVLSGGTGAGKFASFKNNAGFTTPGEYKIVITATITSESGKVYNGGEYSLTLLKQPVVISHPDTEALCANERYVLVDDFKEFNIYIDNADEVTLNNDVKVTINQGETVVATATVTLEDVSATRKNIKIAFDLDKTFAQGEYSIVIPAALYSVNGTANAAYPASTFKYEKLPLSIAASYDNWKSEVTKNYEIAIFGDIVIVGADEVVVDDTKVVTMTINGGEPYEATIAHEETTEGYGISFEFATLTYENIVEGTYVYTIPAGLYTVNGVANEEVVKTVTYTNVIELSLRDADFRPLNTSSLAKVEKLYVWAEGVEFALNAAEDAPKAYISDGENTLAEATAVIEEGALAITFDPAFATIGNFFLVLPENMFTMNGKANAFTHYEIAIVKPLSIESVTPAEGEVEGISEIIITFSEMVDAPQYDDIAVNGPNYSDYAFIYQYDENLSPKQMKFVAENPITAPGEYSLNCEYLHIFDLMGNVIEGFDQTFTWTIKEPAPEEPKGDIDVTKEYYLEAEYMAGMSSAKGYITIDGMQNQVYIDSEKKQAFKFELVENGTDIFYTLSTVVEGGTGSSKLYLNCDAAAVMGTTNASQLFFEKEATSDKYYVKCGDAYFRASDNKEWVGTNQAYIVKNENCDSYFRIKFTLVADGEEPGEPEVPEVTADPLVLVSEPVTVEKISKIELEFDREVASVDANAKFKLLKRDESTASQFGGGEAQVSGNKVTFHLMSPISESGTFTFVIPADAIVAADGGKVAETSYKITVVAAPKPSKSSIDVENSLSTLTIAFSEEIDFVAGHTVEKLEVKAGNEVVAEIPVANIAINAKNLTLTLDKAIAPEGTTQYTVAIPANFIVKKGSTTLQYAGGNITVKVKVPFALKGITPVSGSTVEAFENIVIEYNAVVDFYPSALNFKLVNTADNSEIALTATKDGKVVTLTTDAEVPNGTYTLAGLNNIVDKSTYIAPAELPEYTITVKEAEDTAIDGVDAEAENVVIYDLSGRRVNEIVKGGIYIINGKKVLVK